MPKNNSIGKINAGIFRQRGKHNLNHNVATTFDFGRVQPLFCKFMLPNSKIQGSLDAKVRVMPMPLPPFGDVKLKVYGQFVKCADLMHSWPEFISGQTYSSSITSYAPTHVPRLLNGISMSNQKLQLNGNSVNASLLSLLMPFGKWTFYPARISTSSQTDITPDGDSNFETLIRDSSLNQVVIESIHPTLPDTYTEFEAVVNLINSIICPNTEAYTHGFMGLSKSRYVYGGTPMNPTVTNMKGTMQAAVKAGFNFTPVGADFLLTIPPRIIAANPTIYKMFIQTEVGVPSDERNEYGIVVVVSLDQYGRNLLSLFNSLGIQIAGHVKDPDYVNLMPLFAFYKAYFDIFVPERNIQWTSTNAHMILDYLNQFNREISSFFEDPSIQIQNDRVTAAQFHNFLRDCAAAYSTCDPNYFTQAIDNATQSESVSINITDADQTINADPSIEQSHYGLFPASLGAESFLTRFGISLLNRLSKFINTNTVIGRNINDFFKAHFDGFSGINEDSDFAGASEIDIQLGDVISTATTSESNLGDFSGVGFGRGDYNFDYSTKEAGYFIILASIIPVSNYVQGNSYDSMMTERLQFPWPEFDALGYDKLKQSEVCQVPIALPYGSTDVSRVQVPNQVFGYSPRYTGYKVHQSVYSGSFCIRGLRENYLPFTLDNFITNDITTQDGTDQNPVYRISYPDNLTCGQRWRYLNKYPYFNNFERIFYNQRPNNDGTGKYKYFTNTNPYEDNFVAYIGIKCLLTDGLLPISSSYDTIDGSDFYVKKA